MSPKKKVTLPFPPSDPRNKSFLREAKFEKENDEGGGTCKVCRKMCDTDSQFLRHVTQSKNCLTHHDPDFIENLRRECRLRSKRKWFRRNWDSRIKEERKAERKSNLKSTGKSNPRYVSKEERSTEVGKSFWKLFSEVFDECHEKAEKKMEEISQLHEIPKNLEMDTSDKALDHAFSNIFSIVKDVEKNDLINCSQDEAFEMCMVKLEDIYDEKFDEEYKDLQYSWRIHTFLDINKNLFPNAINKAYGTLYQEQKFKDCFFKAQDHSLDLIFLDLITKESYFSYINDETLQNQLSAAYDKFFNEELRNQSKENGLNEELKHIIEMSFKKRFAKEGLQYCPSILE